MIFALQPSCCRDLRRARQAIIQATRDTAQFLVTALDASKALSLSPTLAQGTLMDSQQQLAFRAHLIYPSQY